MRPEILQKRDELINHFGTIEKYQLNLFNSKYAGKTPESDFCTCDEFGNIEVDQLKLLMYIESETSINNITMQELIERDQKTNEIIIQLFYNEIFNL
jgi:hypothetical protein